MKGFPLKLESQEILNNPPFLFIQSNQNLKLFTNTYGGSYIKFNQISISSKISSKDNGVFFYIKDKKTEEVWSITPWPTLKSFENYSIEFDTKTLTFKSTYSGIESILKIVIDQKQNVLVYELTLRNLTNEIRDLEIVNYSNIVLIDDYRKYQDHRAFHNLSIQSRFDEEMKGLFFYKRDHNSNSSYPVIFFKFYTESELSNISFESNRDRFIGRTKDLVRPSGVDLDLTNFCGNILDPVAVFKTSLTLAVRSKSRLYLSIVCDRFEQNIKNTIEQHLDSFKDVTNYFLELAQQSIPLLKELNIDEIKALLYQRMGSYMITGNQHTDEIKRNLPTNSGTVDSLWKNKISGDYPILLVIIDNSFFNELVIDVINFHKYLVRSGYDLDIVFLIDTDPNENTRDLLVNQISSQGYQNKIDKNTGVFILENYILDDVDSVYLKHFARLIVNSSNFNKVLENE